MVDSQKKGMGASSGGMRIDNHSWWGGSGSPRFPDGPHKTKDESSAEGAGSVTKYIDTSAAIKKSQVDAVKQVKSHQGRLPEWRN